eukprot:TRINITY_DN9244_c0_g1_i1.p1 TRINITY_DN9244_c0_g1~~TRINITY_DN9244_c0_g1_i1.p1  ORF type:complete len:332 (-),score=42.01 TRINITY_DN9244_c0_g1_i1:388-1383(-)
MRALVVSQLVKDPSELSIGVAEEPQKDDDGCVLVEIHAIGLNFFEFLMVQGKYQTKPDLPFIPGSEFSGVVVSTSPNVKKVRAGDRVYGSSMMGAFAERISVPETNVRRMPEGMSFSEGAAFGMVYATSYAGLVLRAQVRPGETVLVHAAAGGVGTAAVQIAKSLGATVIATVGSKEKVGVAKEAGADHVIDLSSTDDFASAVKDLTGGRGADVIYDPVGGGVFDRSLSCVAWNGRRARIMISIYNGALTTCRAYPCCWVCVWYYPSAACQPCAPQELQRDGCVLGCVPSVRAPQGGGDPDGPRGHVCAPLCAPPAVSSQVLLRRAACGAE